MKSHTQISTAEAARIAKRLLNHWKHKFEVAETEADFTIFMPDATIQLMPQPDVLLVSIDSTLEDLSHLEQVVLDHLSRMAQQEFTATWQHQ
ncbi:MAG: DUF2218 domain-containing protein [Acinetobacter sp.]|jgi:hypothetical protein|uniref:DUF2218 domain-containing protein n=1 Tax=Acinetobacter bohemicus TaxID=1435036 RepID=A0A1I6TM15_9GAMM|nr:DUF2218 domain-containing protein [Acinetobacter bohemicus]KAB0652583.1 DUF2218 domain-containing protein [Acinetobacter bohemicus]MBP7894837.1 DUF2218 domain-containing protein [Acinetobacter sp.]MBP8027535.1 DUF2218 domain-containing protein [Acinetobacter sp.]SFS90214.1 hypothetical protein SAMN05444586_101195 [Acinetobacter bohemicus]